MGKILKQPERTSKKESKSSKFASRFGETAAQRALALPRGVAKLWDKWGDIQRRDDYDPNSETGRRELIKFEKMLKEFANKGAVKKAKGGLIKSRKKSKPKRDGAVIRGRTGAKYGGTL